MLRSCRFVAACGWKWDIRRNILDEMFVYEEVAIRKVCIMAVFFLVLVFVQFVNCVR